MSQKKQALKNTDKIWCYIEMYFRQSLVVYISNCHIVCLSLPKDENDFHETVFMICDAIWENPLDVAKRHFEKWLEIVRKLVYNSTELLNII